MAVKTIGTNGDYTTIALWSAYVKALSSLTEDETGVLIDAKNYAWGTTSDLDFSSVTNNGHKITLKADDGTYVNDVRHNGDFGNGARVEAAASYGGVYQCRFLIVEDFSIINTEISNGGARCFSNCTDTVLERVIAKTNSSGGNSEPYQLAAGCYAESCRAVDGTTGFNLINNTAYISACTAINAGVGFTSSGATNAVYNNVAYNCTTGWAGTWTGGGSNNASEDGTHVGTNGVTISGNPFDADGYTPASGGQLDEAGFNYGHALDAANNVYNDLTPIGAYAVNDEAYILDNITGSMDGAFSLSRYLNVAYKGSAVVRLREDATDVEADFKLNARNKLATNDANEYSVSHWLTLYSATNARISDWYDQVGVYDLASLTNAEQPLLNESGINGKAIAESIKTENTDMQSGTYQMVSANGSFVSCVYQINDTSNAAHTLFGDPNSSTWGLMARASLDGFDNLADNGFPASTDPISVSVPHVVIGEFPSGADPKNVTCRISGRDEGLVNHTVDARSGAHRIFTSGSQTAGDSYMGELLFTNSVISNADRSLIEQDQGIQFGVIINGVDYGVADSGVLGDSPLGVLPLGTITAAAVDGATNLIIADAVHTLVSDNADLTQAHSIVIQSGLHGLTSDNVTLDAATSVDLVISESAHSLISDNIALAQEHNLAVASSLHGLVSDNVALTQAHVLSIADALQSTTSDNVILTVSTILDVQNGLHTQVVDNVDLSQEHNLAIQDGLHGLISDNVNLTQDHTLVVNDALHATISDIINLTVPTGAITPEARIFVINEDDRVYIIAKENRIFTVTN